MTPAERIVVATAERWVAEDESAGLICRALVEAVEALRLERSGRPSEEMEIPWSQVLDGELFLNPKNGKWYMAKHVNRIPGAPVRVTVADENGRELTRPAKAGRGTEPIIATYDPTTEVKVKRSEDGQAYDMFATVLWSAPR